MNKHDNYLSRTWWLALVLAACTLILPSTAEAAKKDKGGGKDSGLKGNISAIDKEAKSLTVGGKVVTADETTMITRSGKPGAFGDLKVGEAAEVTTFMLGEKLTAVTIKVGPPPATSGATATPKKKKKP
jgi:hypothetical protein